MKALVAVAVIAVVVVASRSAVQAAPTTVSIPNYNFQSYDVYYGNGGSTISPP